MSRFRSLYALLLFAALQATHAADTVVMENPQSGLKSWKKSDRGFSLELIQLLPEFVAATYASRDLPPALFQSMHGYCVFGTVARNETESALAYRVADWRVRTADGKQHRLRDKAEWVAVWKKLGVDFGYSILPGKLTFEPGDWAQGFTTPKLPPGTAFDLIYVWRQHGKTYTGKLENLACPPAASQP